MPDLTLTPAQIRQVLAAARDYVERLPAAERAGLAAWAREAGVDATQCAVDGDEHEVWATWLGKRIVIVPRRALDGVTKLTDLGELPTAPDTVPDEPRER